MPSPTRAARRSPAASPRPSRMPPANAAWRRLWRSFAADRRLRAGRVAGGLGLHRIEVPDDGLELLRREERIHAPHALEDRRVRIVVASAAQQLSGVIRDAHDDAPAVGG